MDRIDQAEPPKAARFFKGALHLRFATGHAGRTCLVEGFRSGLFHFSKPYWDDTQLVVQVLNPTAGLFAGDVLESSIHSRAESRACIIAPSSSQVYSMEGGPPARLQQSFQVDSGASLTVLPRWTVLHRGARFEQVTQLRVSSSAALVYPELFAAGRAGSGEVFQFDSLHSSTELFLDDQLILKELWSCGRDFNTWMWSCRGLSCSYLLSILVVCPDAQAVCGRLSLPSLSSGLIACGLTFPHNHLAIFRCMGTSSVALFNAYRNFVHALGAFAPVSPVWQRV